MASNHLRHFYRPFARGITLFLLVSLPTIVKDGKGISIIFHLEDSYSLIIYNTNIVGPG